MPIVDAWPMPIVDDYLTLVAGHEYFALVDLASGYYQVELAPSVRPRTVFVTEDGKYQYKRLPMGLSEAPFAFQRFMNRAIGNLRTETCLAYFDDIPTMGKDFDDFVANLKDMFNRVRQVGLKLKPEKCRFGDREYKLLGHIVSGNGIRADPDKIETLNRLARPKNLRQLRSIMGLFNYLGRYIPKYAELAAPLFELTRKRKSFEISREHLERIDTIKTILQKRCLLTHFRQDRTTRIKFDASGIAVGGFLEQQDTTGAWNAIYYYSQRLKSYQTCIQHRKKSA